MLLITTIAQNIIISTNRLDEKPVEIQIEGENTKKQITILCSNTIRIPIKKGTYKVTVKENGDTSSKTVYVY